MPNKNATLFAALGWTMLITVLSLITIGGVGDEVKIPYKDKMVHFVFYFVFVLLWFGYGRSAASPKKIATRVFLVAVVYGILMELLQGICTTSRTPDITDAMANTLGALMGLAYIRYKILDKTQV